MAKSPLNPTIETFNRTAGRYTAAPDPQTAAGITRFIADISSHVPPQNRNLLDVGIGTARTSHLWQASGWHVYGVDGAQEMLELAKAKGIPGDHLKLLDLENAPLPFPDITFGMIVSDASLIYLSNSCDVIKDMLSRVAPGGFVKFDTYVVEGKAADPLKAHEVQDFPHGMDVYALTDGTINSIMRKFQSAGQMAGCIPLAEIPHQLVMNRHALPTPCSAVTFLYQRKL